jgi:hypothetical protein
MGSSFVQIAVPFSELFFCCVHLHPDVPLPLLRALLFSKELGFRIKGVQMSFFSPDDVEILARVGNRRFNEKYLATLTPEDITDLQAEEEEKHQRHGSSGKGLAHMSKFIRMKYLDKTWFALGSSSSAAVVEGALKVEAGVVRETTQQFPVDAETKRTHISPIPSQSSKKSILNNVMNNRSFYRGGGGGALTVDTPSVTTGIRAEPQAKSPIHQVNTPPTLQRSHSYIGQSYNGVVPRVGQQFQQQQQSLVKPKSPTAQSPLPLAPPQVTHENQTIIDALNKEIESLKCALEVEKHERKEAEEKVKKSTFLNSV